MTLKALEHFLVVAKDLETTKDFYCDVLGLKVGFRPAFDWILVDGPPSLSEMTESILRGSDLVIVPVRPALPDVWALPWLAAIIRQLQQGGAQLAVRDARHPHRGQRCAARRRARARRVPPPPRPAASAAT